MNQKKWRSVKYIFIAGSVMMLISVLLFFFITYSVSAIVTVPPPHIIYILADDLGWNDVSFHGSPQIPTPNIDALAASGIILNKHYTAPQCTPSRASLMTGRYPTNTGLQHFVIKAGEPSGLPLNLTIMPQHFKRLGYATHLVGKWHLGHYRKEYTPTYRGFDTFFGCWNGVMDYLDYTNYETKNFWGVDLHNGTKIVKDLRGKYATELFTEKAEEVIRNHNTSQPLFLLLSQLAVHVGNSYQPLQAPARHVAKFKHIKDTNRRFHAGVVSALDESVGKIFSTLHTKGMLDNSIVIIVSDNGGQVAGQRGGYGSNWPFRGAKLCLWEGGVRVPAVIWSPLLRLQEPRTSMQMIHLSDWLPTLYAAAGGNVDDLGEIDGMNLWQHLTEDLPSPREEILLNVDPHFGMSALIQRHYKLVNGTLPYENRDSWFGPSGREHFSVSSMDEWVWRNVSVVKDILQRTGRWVIKTPDRWRDNATVNCGKGSRPSRNGGCDPTAHPCLYNLSEDPCEYDDLSSKHPEMVESMMERIVQLNASSMKSVPRERDPKADPRCHGFAYVPWLDEEHLSSECYEDS